MKLLVIGSSSDSNIVLNSPYVSAYHAEILLLDNGDIILEDKGSRNGTFLNNDRLTPNKEVSIKRGDNVRMANVILDWSRVPSLQIDKDVKEMRGIGTNFRNRHQLQGEKVSRFHATLKKKSSGKWFIQDHSRNGTTVNGSPIPKDQDVPLKKGDIIMCAGQSVPNPCNEKSGGGWKPTPVRIGGIAASLLMLFALSFAVKYALNGGSCKGPNIIKSDSGPIVIEDSLIFKRYKSSTVLLFAGYYFKVSAKLGEEEFPFYKFDLPTEVIMDEKGKIYDVSKTGMLSRYFGTGFFVSKKGRLITNLHIAKPWLFGNEKEKIESVYKQQLQIIANNYASEYPNIPLGAFVAEVKVEGERKFIGLVANGEDFDDENFVKCKVIAAGEDTNIDVALLRTVNDKLPEGCTYLNPDSIDVSEKALAPGTHVYTVGFPSGIGFQDLKSNDNKIRLFGQDGKINQESNQYSFGFNAATTGGASGSPIFNEYGMLIGVLNAGYMQTQGFNFGIKAKYVKELIDKDNEK